MLALQVFSCREICPTVYVLELPLVSEAWVSILGEPWWRVEWLAPDGQKQIADIKHGSKLEIEIPVTWANPVTVWPYWPEHNLIPGLFKPAGALFPFDAEDMRLNLTWEAGLDAVFYWELALANRQSENRLPANFDWPRFRGLFKAETINEAVRKDPWLADWQFIAERTATSNFDTRRLVPQATTAKIIPVSAGPWYGTSPFANPLVFAEDADPVFTVRPGLNVWVSADGLLRINGDVWVFIEW